MSQRVAFTEFPSLKATQGVFKRISLKDFAKECARSYKDKHAQPLCVPDVLPFSLRNAGVEPQAASAIFLDFDSPVLQPEQAAAKLEKAKASFVLYCTYSWTSAKPKYRIVLPLDKPVTLETRKRLIERIEKLLPGVAPESYDIKRGYFVGCNGKATPPPILYNGNTADQVKWPLLEAPRTEFPRGQPADIAKQLVFKHGHKLKDGEGRWQAVEYLATRVSARNYSEAECHAMLNELIARYFDPVDVTAEKRATWEARVAHWLKKDAPKKLNRIEPATRRAPSYGDLPSTFTLSELVSMDLPPTEWIIEDLLPPGLAMMAGPPKIGKSALALDLTFAVASGEPFLGKWKTRQSQIIYYDLESGHHLVRERCMELMHARKFNKKNGKNVSFSLISETGSNAILQLRADLEANPAVRLIVVDIFARIRDMSQDLSKRGSAYQVDYEAISQFQDLCAEHPNLCILLVHHTNKRSGESMDHWQDAISGTQGIAGGTHTNLVLQRPSKQGLSGEDKELMQQYLVLNAAGKRVKETTVTLAKSGDGCTWRISEKTPEQVKAGHVQREIMAVVESDRQRLWTAKAVSEALAKNLNTTKNLMLQMGKKGMLAASPQGYTLPQLKDEPKKITGRMR